MAPQQQQQPTWLSGHPQKPSERKRAQSIPASAILQPPKKKAKRKVKVAKKRQKTIPVPLPSPSPSLLPSPLSSPLPLLSPATPAEPISVDEVNEGKDENTKEPMEVEDEDVDSPPPPPPPPTRFTSIWKAVTSSKNKSLPGIKLAVFDTKNIYYFKLDLWQEETIQRLLLWKFKIT